MQLNITTIDCKHYQLPLDYNPTTGNHEVNLNDTFYEVHCPHYNGVPFDQHLADYSTLLTDHNRDYPDQPLNLTFGDYLNQYVK